MSYIASIHSRSFSPACGRAKELGARPLSHLRYVCHGKLPLSFQKPLPFTILGKEHHESSKKPRSNSSKLLIRERSSTSGADNAPNAPRSELPSHEEGRRSHISKSFTRVMDHLQSNIFIAGQRLNDLTGYSGIEALKRDIEIQGQHESHPQLNLSPLPLTSPLFRNRCAKMSLQPATSSRSLLDRHQPALVFATRSQRVIATEARLDLQRPGALYGSLPIGSRQ